MAHGNKTTYRRAASICDISSFSLDEATRWRRQLEDIRRLSISYAKISRRLNVMVISLKCFDVTAMRRPHEMSVWQP